MNALNIRELCKTYVTNKQQNNILKNVNFSVEEGEMVGIMGPSGSGKSTLLYMVSGMDLVTSGHVEFLGKDLAKLNEKELSTVRLREMGFIFQQMHMVKNLSVLDNILLPGYQLETKNRKQVVERAKKLMQNFGILDIENSDVNEISGGQLQRACICRSLINQPKILFADEPTGALNQNAADTVISHLNQINEEGVTVMMVTHDIKVAARCSRVIYLVDGNIKGEYNIGKYKDNGSLRERERELSQKLMGLGW